MYGSIWGFYALKISFYIISIYIIYFYVPMKIQGKILCYYNLALIM